MEGLCEERLLQLAELEFGFQGLACRAVKIRKCVIESLP